MQRSSPASLGSRAAWRLVRASTDPSSAVLNAPPGFISVSTGQKVAQHGETPRSRPVRCAVLPAAPDRVRHARCKPTIDAQLTQARANNRSERAAQPRLEWERETLFRSIDNGRRER